MSPTDEQVSLAIVLEKLKWIEERQTERHAENRLRHDRQELLLEKINGRLNRHDTEILGIKIEQERVARLANADAAQELLDQKRDADLEHAPLSFKSAKAIVTMVSGACVIVWFLLTQVLGYHK